MKSADATMPNGAYHQREKAGVPNEEMLRVGPGTPGGEYLRRFWHPVAMSSEVQNLPKRIKVLCEDLVLFRTRAGEVGLVRPHCPHRGASLEFGIPDDCGLRCCYHGWLIGVDGKVLEAPAEPEASPYTKDLYHGAYPVKEYEGLIFAYMGPTEEMPPLPVYDIVARLKPGQRLIPGGWTPGRTYHWPCNWVQVKENAMDPVHTFYLHTIASGAQFTPEFGIVPEIEYKETPIGMVYIASRKVGDNAWVRVHDLIMPNIHIVASVNEDGKAEKNYGPPYLMHWATPIDDENFLEIGWLIESEEMKFDQAMIEKLHFGMMDDRPFAERQMAPGDYDAQVSQGPIHNHGREHLGVSDRGVTMFRRMLRAGIDDVRNGKDPKGLNRAEGEVIATHTQNAVFKLGEPGASETLKDQLRNAGRRVAAGEFRC